MIDTGCLCFSVFDENLVRKNNISTLAIKPKHLRLADGKSIAAIDRIASVDIDIDGRQETIWGYVMPSLAYPMILGKPWMEKNKVCYSAKSQTLRFGSRKHGMVVHVCGYYRETLQKAVLNNISSSNLPTGVQLSSRDFLNRSFRQELDSS